MQMAMQMPNADGTYLKSSVPMISLVSFATTGQALHMGMHVKYVHI
jgi:hypothetical protein